MSWLALLKNQKDAKTCTTKTTKTPQEDEKRVSVVSVAYPQGPFQEKKGTTEAQPPTPETTETPLLGVLGVPIPPVCEKQQGGFGSYGGFGGTTPAHSGKAAPLAIDQKDPANHLPELAQGTAPKAAANDPGHDRLLALAMAFCDHISASAQAREDWRRDVLETPQHLRQGLGEYLRQQLRQPHLLWRNQK